MSKFKHAAFIRMNTPEIREGLEKLGYERNIGMYDNSDGIYLRTFGFTYGQFSNEYLKTGAIDCGTNIPLFLAIAAIREDSDYMQWFVHENGEFIMCWQSELKHVIDNYYEDYCVADLHKATPEELINYFKDK